MNSGTEDGCEAVSPVIGVILMVAITVILAAVIGTFVLGLGDSVEEEARAGINVDVDSATENVSITATTLGNADYLFIRNAERLRYQGGPRATPPPSPNDFLSVNSPYLYINETGTTVKLADNSGSGLSGTISVVAVIGEDPGSTDTKNGATTPDQPPDSATQTTIQQIDFDFTS